MGSGEGVELSRLEDVLKGSFDLIVGTKKHLSMGPKLDLPSQLSPIRRAKLYLPGLLKHPLRAVVRFLVPTPYSPLPTPLS